MATPKQPRAEGGAREGLQLSPAQSYLRHHRRCASDALSFLIGRPFAAALTSLVVGLALSLPLILIFLSYNIDRVVAPLQASGVINVYFDPALTTQQASDLAQVISKRPDVRSTDFIDKTEALEQFKDDPGWSQTLSQLGNNPLPASVVVTPLGIEAPEGASNIPGSPRASALVDALNGLPGVDVVQSDSEWLERLRLIQDFLTSFFAMLVTFFGIIVCVIIINTVRLNVEAKREMILVTQMIGGTHAFVRRPFLYLGFFYSLVGMVIAAIIAVIGAGMLESAMTPLLRSYELDFELYMPDIDAFLGFILLSLVLCVGSAFVAASVQIKRIEYSG
ncbi:permease-like cell division protein FtsX [Allohahella marinimesophila]|uniref:Cell division protein FtsX n=1 Tax=Allohahella marinimesophila TaxID=1054972 RepID=A0ABP7PI16_9GAMM